MYSRSYFPNDTDISIPENYDGTAFAGESPDDEIRMPKIEPVKNEIKFSPKNDEKQCCNAPRDDECEACMASKGASRAGLFGIDLKGTPAKQRDYNMEPLDLQQRRRLYIHPGCGIIWHVWAQVCNRSACRGT